MNNTTFAALIAARLGLAEKGVANTLELLDEGATIPFISRYRKERTGSMDEVQIAGISDLYLKLQDITKRKETIIKTITEQGKMTSELQRRIDETWDATVLEDIYLPFKPKRRTRAQVAREQGLEPLATTILLQRERDIMSVARKYVKGEVKDIDMALKGAQDILAETMYFSYDKHSDADLYALDAADVMEIIRMNRNGVKPESLKAEPEPASPEFVTAVGDDAINRFDAPKRKKKRNKNRRK